MSSLAIITGAGTGIGRATALAMAEQGITVLGVGRREGPLDDLKQQKPDFIETVSADVSTPEGRQAIADAAADHKTVDFLVHNAAIIGPSKPLVTIDLAEWQQAIRINVEGPLFLTKKLLPKLPQGRVLHISSGAAHMPFAGFGTYCVTKAALYMIYQVLREELEASNIAMGSMKPGVCDTPMQDELQTLSDKICPKAEIFRTLKQENRMTTPEMVAAFTCWLLLTVDKATFSENEWSIYDEFHHQHWAGDFEVPGLY